MKRREIANAVDALAKRYGLSYAARSEIVTLIESAIVVEVEKAAELAHLTTDLNSARDALAQAERARDAERAARELADAELLAARVYITYTSRAYHHDSEQDALWRIWHDARVARESAP